MSYINTECGDLFAFLSRFVEFGDGYCSATNPIQVSIRLTLNHTL
jgi:hypothetical protein